MKLYQLLQSFEFEEIFPTVNVMFPNAQLHRDIFEKAFDMLCNIQPITSKKVIKFELMEDPYCPLMDCYFYTSANGE